MAFPNDAPDLPDLDQFAARIEEAANATEQFASTLNAASQPATTTVATSQAAQVKDDPIQRDILNALHLIHDELVALKQLIENMTG